MSAHRLIRYPFRGTSIVPFDAYGRSVLRHRRPLNFSACGYSAPCAGGEEKAVVEYPN